jgi:hypothetical protein
MAARTSPPRTKNLIVHGGKRPGVDALEGLSEGTLVVIHHRVSDPQAAAEEIDLLGDVGLLRRAQPASTSLAVRL